MGVLYTVIFTSQPEADFEPYLPGPHNTHLVLGGDSRLNLLIHMTPSRQVYTVNDIRFVTL
jgi:hypothetical protein